MSSDLPATSGMEIREAAFDWADVSTETFLHEFRIYSAVGSLQQGVGIPANPRAVIDTLLRLSQCGQERT